MGLTYQNEPHVKGYDTVSVWGIYLFSRYIGGQVCFRSVNVMYFVLSKGYSNFLEIVPIL